MPRIRVRARAVDMLGRQQIAGIPTAIHELFKNAHDAYAERVQVDFFRSDRLLVIRDDGFGMTREDFESRWLTLGTESKIGNDKPDADVYFEGRPAAPTRPIMGEKGIGRLAIAAIGPQVLVMTRAARRQGLQPLIASLIHWGMFEIPGVDLDRIDIPIEEVLNGEMPSKALIKKLADRVRTNIKALGGAVPASDRDRFLADLDLANFDTREVQSRLVGPTLAGSGFGTHFYIRPTNPLLVDDIEGRDAYGASPLEQVLLGFSNTMMPGRPHPTVLAEFLDHKEDGTVDELIGGKSFFTPEEFESADHHIDGYFDAYGQFQGTVAVYEQPPQECNIRWPGASGHVTECGPFRIKFAYVQGEWQDTRLAQDTWAELKAKLNRIGGLYVYRDGIRILPYGRPDYDFLSIERRRTKSARDWYFSYRRIFGAVEITQAENADLVEKAGREGFRTNRAYRQFVSVLENFFERLAIDFFRPTAQYGDAFNIYKSQLNREKELLKKREKATRVRRKELVDRLNGFFEDLEHGVPIGEAARIKQSVQVRLEHISQIGDSDSAAKALLELERDARQQMAALDDKNTISLPRTVGLSKSLQADWLAYTRNVDKVRREVLLPLAQEVDDMITAVASSKTIALDRRRRLVASLETKRDAIMNGTGRLRRNAEEAFRELAESADETMGFCVSRVAGDIERAFIDMERVDFARFTDSQLRDLQNRWEERIDAAAMAAKDMLEALKDQLQSVTKALKDRETLDETTAALESTAEAYREELDAYIELAQIGMALGIVQHEFGVAVRNIRSAIRRLKPWADGTPDLKGLYKDLKIEFDHLDGYLKLFTPLSRRVHREAVDLSGEEIRRYLHDVFDERLERHSIRLVATPEFDQAKVHGYPSTYLPAFVNVVDNAIYWIATDKDAERLIRLDSDGVGFSIWNGGPGIERRIADRIFEFGETTKPGGRGMGLYLSRQALRREGFDLTLEADGVDKHPAFRIAPTTTALQRSKE